MGVFGSEDESTMASSCRPYSWVVLVVLALLCLCDAQMTCSPTFCRNGGTCVVVQGSPTCRCPSGFTGSTCEVSDFNGCRTETDMFGITWPRTEVGETAMTQCPNSDEYATRTCSPMGWREPNSHECETFDFRNARTKAKSAFAADGRDLQTRLRDSELVTSDVRGFTGPTMGTSLLPADLNTTNQILFGIVDLLEESLSTTDNITDQTVFNDIFTDCLNIFSNVLDVNNLDGWITLQEVGAGSQMLLDNAERYGNYLSYQLEDSENRRLWAMDNIVFGAMRNDPDNGQPITFPESLDDLRNTSFNTTIPASITIPPQVLMERRGTQTGRTVPVTTILFRNMEAALPTDENGTTMTVASMVLSTQVTIQQGVPGQSSALSENPVTLSFNFDANENASEYRCAYWKFSDPIGSGGWAFDGVEMVSNETENGVTTITCKSTHLTSFAILVDVSGTLNPGDNTTGVSQGELVALQVVSYIGCAISIVCLLASIIFFLTLRKKLFTSVHYFIHLNLAISLCLGYLVFVAGVEPARANRGACIFIAAVLHYLFLAVFCWMLCEGIMLYLMLVVVFSQLSKKWWFFLMLGYGLPIIPVVIAVGARTSEYGVEGSDGNLVYCWLSTENGVIWAFVAPMLAIITVNVFFLFVALATVFRTTRSKAQRSNGNSKYKEYGELFRTLMVATAVLLPILGLTWVLGLFAVNRNSTVFAWLFTILNSLQGVFFFIFHVLRSEKVWQSSRAKSLRSKASSTFRSTTRSSLSGSTFKKPSTDYSLSMSMKTEKPKIVPTAFHSTEDTELSNGQAWNSTEEMQGLSKDEEGAVTMVTEEPQEKPATASRDDTCSEEGNTFECPQSANLVDSD